MGKRLTMKNGVVTGYTPPNCTQRVLEALDIPY